MHCRNLTLSAALLRSVLAGHTYEVAARNHGLTRTAVERRVKSLVRDAVHQGLIEGLSESQLIYVRTLRSHRPAIESALETLVQRCADEAVTTGRPSGSGAVPVLSADDVRVAVRRARLNTVTPERDAAMVLILLATGLRPLEVARLDVRDYLNADGSVRIDSVVRAEVAANHRARPLFFCSQAATEAIDAYLRTRPQPGASVSGGRYRGLAPNDGLFLTEAGCRFLVEVVKAEGRERSLCQEIHYAYRKIFRRVGFPGLSALSVRQTVMDRLLRRGADEEQIGELLGIRELRPIKRERRRLEDLVQELV